MDVIIYTLQPFIILVTVVTGLVQSMKVVSESVELQSSSSQAAQYIISFSLGMTCTRDQGTWFKEPNNLLWSESGFFVVVVWLRGCAIER